jgi:hypothetical protein
MSADTQQPLSPTTGEPMTTIARRARAGLWTLIVMDVSGTLALIISYTYLWSLNVNGGWAPPGASLTSAQTNAVPAKSSATFAADWPFWAILGIVVVATIAMWFGYREGKRGNHAGLVVGAGAALLVAIGGLVAQWIQISTFPFGAGNGSYASVVLLLCASNIFHFLMLIFLLTGIFNRARKGLINKSVYFQAQLMSYWMVWICIAFLLGALCTTFLQVSPNTDPAIFGTFQQQQ